MEVQEGAQRIPWVPGSVPLAMVLCAPLGPDNQNQ